MTFRIAAIPELRVFVDSKGEIACVTCHNRILGGVFDADEFLTAAWRHIRQFSQCGE